MGEAKRRKEAGSGPRDRTPEWELDLGWEKAAALATGVIERANAEGMQVFVRPTTAPSPHGPDSPLEIETAEDGRSVTVTLFGKPETLRREWILRLGGAPGVQVIRETKA